MAHETWPADLAPYNMSFYLQPHVGGSESPFSRQRKVYGLSAPRWICRMQFRGGASSEWGEDGPAVFGPRLDALIARLEGGLHPINLWDLRRDSFRNASSGISNQPATAGDSTMVLTGLDPGSTVHAGDYLGGDGRPHIVVRDAIADAAGEAEVEFKPPLAQNMDADSVILGNPTGTFRLVGDDAGDNMSEVGQLTGYDLYFEEDVGAIPASQFFIRLVRGWNEDTDVSATRFPHILPTGDTTALISFSERNDTWNDGEDGFKLVCADVAWDTEAQTVTVSATRDIEVPGAGGVPGDWANGLGSAWGGVLIRLPSGRILNVYNRLDSPMDATPEQGTFSHPDAEYDLMLRYSDDLGQNWSAATTLAEGGAFYAGSGIPPMTGSGAGFNIAGGSNIAAVNGDGRCGVVGYAPSGSNVYFGSVYTDDPDGLAWTFGQFSLTDAAKSLNEPSVVALPDGTLKAFQRSENTLGRGVWSSPDFEAWTYDGFNAQPAIQNVAAAALYTEDGDLILGGSAAATMGHRNDHKFFISRNDGTTFPTVKGGLFLDPARIGYGSLAEVEGGLIGVFELSNGGTGLSVNQQPNLLFVYANPPALRRNFAESTAASAYAGLAQQEYDAYEARVVADGGGIEDPDACLAAIEAAIAGLYYDQIGVAVSPRWGRKLSGSNITRLYSIGPSAQVEDLVSTGGDHPVIETASQAYATAIFAAGDVMTAAGLTLRHGEYQGAVLIDSQTADSTVGMSWRFTVSAARPRQAAASANFLFMTGNAEFNDGTAVLQLGPEWATATKDAMHWIVNHEANLATNGQNGTDRETLGWFAAVAEGATADLTLQAEGAAKNFVEGWFFTGAGLTRAAIAQCGADVGARY